MNINTPNFATQLASSTPSARTGIKASAAHERNAPETGNSNERSFSAQMVQQSERDGPDSTSRAASMTTQQPETPATSTPPKTARRASDGKATPKSGNALPPLLNGIALPLVASAVPVAKIANSELDKTPTDAAAAHADASVVATGLGEMDAAPTPSIASKVLDPQAGVATGSALSDGEEADLTTLTPKPQSPSDLAKAVDQPWLATLADTMAGVNAAGLSKAPPGVTPKVSVTPRPAGIPGLSALSGTQPADAPSPLPLSATPVSALSGSTLPDDLPVSPMMKLINSAERLANKTDEGLPPITASSDTTDFSSLAAMFNVNPAPANNLAGAPAPMAPPVHAPIGSQEWGQQVGESMVWAANQKLSEAQISLNPEHLGPLQIKLSLSGSDATVLFSAHNQLAADALQASSGQLKSMLAQAGFTQVNVDVSQQSGGNASGFSGQGYRQGPSTPNEASDDTRALASPVNASRISRSAIDAYA